MKVWDNNWHMEDNIQSDITHCTGWFNLFGSE